MKDNAIIQPIRRKNLISSDFIILVSAEPDINTLIQTLDLKNIKKSRLMMSSLYSGLVDGHSVSLIGPMIGAPYATLILEEMIAAGGQNFIFLGWCGSLSEKVSIGDCIVPESAFIDEGTSLCYPNSSDISYPDTEQSNGIYQAIKKVGQPVYQGIIWCTDGFYQETPEKVKFYQQKDAMGVEMETSALFTVAKYRQVILAALLVVSDNLHNLSWQTGFKTPEFKKGRMQSCLAIRKLIESI
ncbi:purine or other phosphorylase family 1 [Candidatus Magnetomorum sp. HK-1]|nr:purine or other phosphorylase family 1 [Candidatus Magnetomorum sp. HK-1]